MSGHAFNSDSEILAKLGIISDGPSTSSSPRRTFRPSPPEQRPGSGASFEEVRIDDWTPIGPRSISDFSDDDEFEGPLIETVKKPGWRYRGRNRIMARGDGAGSLFCKGLLICSGFFTLGLCLSIIGPTLPDIQLSTKADSLVSVAGIVTASGFGALLGITFGSAVYALANPFFVMGVILCGTAAITLTIPWCTTITGLNLVCFIQGICLGTVERGGYSLFFAYWPKRYSALQLFYVALAFGACVAPLVTTPFVFNHVQPSLTGAVGSGNNNHMRHKREPPLDFNETLTTLNPAALNTPIAAGAAGNENGTSPDSSLTTLPVAVKPSVAVGDGSIDTKAKQNSVMRNKINEDKAAPTPSTANVSSTTPGELAITTSASLLSGMQTQPEGTEMDGVKVTSSSLSTSVPAEAGASSSTTTSTTTTSTTTTTATSTTTTTTTTTPTPTTTTTTTTEAPKTTTLLSTAAVIVAEETTAKTSTEAVTIAASAGTSAKGAGEKAATETNKATNAGPSEGAKEIGTTESDSSYFDYLLKTVSQRVKEFNNARLAYAIVALISLLSTLLFVVAFACCCVRCRSVKPIDDLAFNPGLLCKIRENRISMLLALLFVLLLTTVEANMSSLLTVYSLVRQADKSKAEISQANGVALTSIFWLGMATSRIFTAMCGKLLNSTKTLIFLLSLATLSCSFLAVFANGSTAVLWMGTLTLGTALGPVFPLSFCWLDQRIGLSPWASSLWLIAASFGRITGPVTTAYMMSVHGPILLPAMVVIGALLASVTFLFLQKAVKVAGHLRAVDELSRHVKDENSLRENGDAGGGLGSRYARLADEADDILEMDDFLSEDENVIHFDRSDHLQRSA